MASRAWRRRYDYLSFQHLGGRMGNFLQRAPGFGNNRIATEREPDFPVTKGGVEGRRRQDPGRIRFVTCAADFRSSDGVRSPGHLSSAAGLAQRDGAKVALA